MYGLKRVPSKACLHHAAVVLAGCARIQEVVGMLAGDAARGSLLGDSSGFSIMQYEDWEDAKRGIISRRRFVKLHVLADARGKKIVSCEVTKGTAHDSPWFRRIFARVPGGAGCVMLDAAYDAYENYRGDPLQWQEARDRPAQGPYPQGLQPEGQRCSGGGRRTQKSLRGRTTGAAWWSPCSRRSRPGLAP